MKILILIWILVWFWPGIGTTPLVEFGPVSGPLTAHEKILLGYHLDINRLSPKELEILPGIGPATAAKIAAFREQRGPIQRLEELEKIRGIGPKTVEALKPYLSKI